MAAIKLTKQKKSSHEVMEKLKSLCTVDGNAKWCITMEKEFAVPQNTKMKLPYDPVILFLGIYPNELKTVLKRHLYTHVVIIIHTS
jgi:hypothetical protein